MESAKDKRMYGTTTETVTLWCTKAKERGEEKMMKMAKNISPSGTRKRVFLVDQFPISRLAVSDWLKQTPDLAVCGEADSEMPALSAIRRLVPDVVVTEVLRQQDLGFVRSLHKRYPHLPILVFSFRDEHWYAPRALEAGADGYLMKGINVGEFVNGVRAAMGGRVVLSREMRGRLLSKCMRRKRHSTPPRRTRRCRASGNGDS